MRYWWSDGLFSWGIPVLFAGIEGDICYSDAEDRQRFSQLDETWKIKVIKWNWYSSARRLQVTGFASLVLMMNKDEKITWQGETAFVQGYTLDADTPGTK